MAIEYCPAYTQKNLVMLCLQNPALSYDDISSVVEKVFGTRPPRASLRLIAHHMRSDAADPYADANIPTIPVRRRRAVNGGEPANTNRRVLSVDGKSLQAFLFDTLKREPGKQANVDRLVDASGLLKSQVVTALQSLQRYGVIKHAGVLRTYRVIREEYPNGH